MKKKRILKWLLAVTLTLALIMAGAAWYLLNYSLTPGERGRDIKRAWTDVCQAYPGMESWRDSLMKAGALHDTCIRTTDGTLLHAYHVKAARPTRRTAVLVHGYMDNAVCMMPLGRMYEQELGFNILLPDLRYAGKSEGDHIQMGWKDRLDVKRWLETIPALFGDSATVVVHGISMGAATTMMLSGEADLPYVRAFVEDCGYTSVRAQFEKELGERFGLPSFPLIDIASGLCRLRYGWNFNEASALKQVEQCRLPMFFIHGGADDFVPTNMVYELYHAKPAPKQIWVTRGSGHALSYHDYPEEYAHRIQNFLQPLL